ncbi:MAG: glycerol-3-phosphate acyltransferase [Eggerthellaceae bacterium]|jgi:glycerol-3-phosphate acyltransferase PlsY
MDLLAALLCAAIGYLCGCFLTADAVMRARTGKHAFDVGSGNPGMANVGAQLGPAWAALVLAGDILKTIFAVALAALVCATIPDAGGLLKLLVACPGGIAFPHSGCLSTACAGIGAVLGHDFPFWHGFSGGKGVAVTCTAVILFNPPLGGLACLIGLAVVVASHKLGVAALLIVCAFTLEMVIVAAPAEVLAFAIVLAVLAAASWYRGRVGSRNNGTKK